MLLGRNRSYLSGFDIDGTSEGNFGQTSSKAFGNTNLNIRRWFSPEHGSIWLMALVRFPTIHTEEQHYLLSQPTPDYLTATADARIASTQPPQQLKVKEVFCTSNSNVRLVTNLMVSGGVRILTLCMACMRTLTVSRCCLNCLRM